jgi:hypothetical protein
MVFIKLLYSCVIIVVFLNPYRDSWYWMRRSTSIEDRRDVVPAWPIDLSEIRDLTK